MPEFRNPSYDLAVVGAGIIGLATALAAVRRGLRVIVIDRDAHAGRICRRVGRVLDGGGDFRNVVALHGAIEAGGQHE